MVESDTMTLVKTPADPFLSWVLLHLDGGDAALVVKNMLPAKMEGCEPGKVPFITTVPVEGKEDRFRILIENQADDVLVLWQNTVHDKEHGIRVIDRNTLEITVPRNARKMERSYVRAFCSNASGIGNDILVPVSYGKVIRDTKQLKRTDKHAQVLYSLMIDRFVNGRTDNDMPINSPKIGRASCRERV